MNTTLAQHGAFRAVLEAFARPADLQRVRGTDGEPASVAELILAAVWEPDDPPVVFTGPPGPGEIAELGRGSETAPETGATAVVLVGEDDPATEVVLCGPGVDGEAAVSLPLSAAALAERAEAGSAWPCGVDLLLVGPGETVRGLPRSTEIREPR